MKTCTRCSLAKALSEFHKNSKLSDGHYYVCKSCRKIQVKQNPRSEYYRNYYEEHKEKRRKYDAKRRKEKQEAIGIYLSEYVKKNRDKLKEYKRIYFQKNKSEINKKSLLYLKKNIQAKLASYLRRRFLKAFRSGYKNGSAILYLGCSVEYLKNYLEYKFQTGMNWDNYGKWHIDHIKPLSKFDLNNIEQVKLACHYSNLQPLWAEDNIAKGAKWQSA